MGFWHKHCAKQTVSDLTLVVVPIWSRKKLIYNDLKILQHLFPSTCNWKQLTLELKWIEMLVRFLDHSHTHAHTRLRMGVSIIYNLRLESLPALADVTYLSSELSQPSSYTTLGMHRSQYKWPPSASSVCTTQNQWCIMPRQADSTSRGWSRSTSSWADTGGWVRTPHVMVMNIIMNYTFSTKHRKLQLSSICVEYVISRNITLSSSC